MTQSDNTTQNTYTFQGIRWIPSYRDFDHDDVDIEAANEKEAWDILNKTVKYWKSVGITHINNVEVKQATNN